jgi:hypothetical protein
MGSESMLAKARDQFLNKGTELVKSELESQATYVIDVQRDNPLRNVDILSNNIVANKDLHKNIKARVLDHCENVKKIILATAHYIESERYQGVDEKIDEMDLSKFNKDRVLRLIGSQKRLSGSFQTLVVVVDMFKKINESIRSELESAKATADGEVMGRMEQTKILLKNAILVYELASFALEFLKQFGLSGIDDIVAIRDDVYGDLLRGDKQDQEIVAKVADMGDDFKAQTMEEIEGRKQVREKVKQKWDKMLSEIKELKEKTDNAKAFVTQLEVIKMNAASRIDILQVIATTQLVENSITAVSKIADISNFEMPKLDGQYACELLGIEA